MPLEPKPNVRKGLDTTKRSRANDLDLEFRLITEEALSDAQSYKDDGWLCGRGLVKGYRPGECAQTTRSSPRDHRRADRKTKSA